MFVAGELDEMMTRSRVLDESTYITDLVVDQMCDLADIADSDVDPATPVEWNEEDLKDLDRRIWTMKNRVNLLSQKEEQASHPVWDFFE